jgi:hypothetical protein
MSEQGYMHRRVQVEVAWFIALSDAGFAEFKPCRPEHALTCWAGEELFRRPTAWPSRKSRKPPTTT